MLRPFLISVGVVATFLGSLDASSGVLLSGGTFKASDGVSPFPENGLMQLINLGDDGVLNPVLEGNWVSGDDVLIDLPYGVGTEFATSGAFDLSEGAVFSPGFLQRQFEFEVTLGVVEEGDLIALRWWPALTPSDSISGRMPLLGDMYGQVHIFSAVNDPLFNTGWIIPAESEPLAIFDPAISEDYNQTIGGTLITTSEFTGVALETVVIPEPGAFAFLMGIFALFLATRRSP